MIEIMNKTTGRKESPRYEDHTFLLTGRAVHFHSDRVFYIEKNWIYMYIIMGLDIGGIFWYK